MTVKKTRYQRVCRYCQELHETTTKSSRAVCAKCKKERGTPR